ncbi:FAD binding domain-containing protein [Thermaerobacter subterraneus]|uniref:Aerobic-type carbon monoxide dehydrogenase, middle subunit CoxM/CutM-like protein n=1 Tax=Thermaerobacter subterraneus DSM 13965 TaxID=867903 RepID=K6PRP5_9FIRM|nr:xanthine dehydrogenase family protein subunit M [Thermaerobacter subterraneus]EKP95612.1 aerobic-type carbon monoxide dehydrogenase, middle subunit CoxM/CutM-like protein [Thermaerobacter subterraneus DSM 13965]
MKPPRFAYHDPRSLDEAVELLGRYGGEAKVLAGGQSLIPLLNFRLARPAALIDINRIPGLDSLTLAGGRLEAGALVRHRQVERSELVRRHCPLLAEAMGWVGHPAIRQRGTLCGSLAHADPAAEIPAVWVALDGVVRARGPQGEREVPAAEFFLTYFTTTLEPTELVVGAGLPLLPPGAGWAFVEVARRHGDFALAAVAAVVELDAQGRIARARLGLAGVGPVPCRARGAEAYLAGREPGEATWKEAAALVEDEVEPDSDLHASSAYRRQLAGVLARRALDQAARRAVVPASGGGEGR